jgi:predicted transport protein
VLKYYFAFARIKNFASVQFGTRDEWLAIYAKVDPATIALREGFTRDVTNIGHQAPGNLEIIIRSIEDLEEAKPLLAKSYEAN